MVLIKKLPPKAENSISIIATSSDENFLKEFGLFGQFNIKIEIPELRKISGQNDEI